MFGASNWHWLNYTDDKFDLAVLTANAARRGTRMHALAKELIELGVRLPETPATTMGMYVNDAIGFRMKAEQILFYSSIFYGTADAIAFSRGWLRIHDLKNGVTKTSFKQLYVYAAFFCLEYDVKPHDFQTELRIYQNDECIVLVADPHQILWIMDRIKFLDQRFQALNQELSM